jgi:restriction system protein
MALTSWPAAAPSASRLHVWWSSASRGTRADLPTLNALIGSVTNLNANHGLLVCWSGFTQAVRRKVNDQFFKIRLWSSDDLLEAIFRTYERLPEEIRKALPLKRSWTLVLDEAG